MATALYLLRAHPELAGEVIALERRAIRGPKSAPAGSFPRRCWRWKSWACRSTYRRSNVRAGLARTEIGDIDLRRGPGTHCARSSAAIGSTRGWPARRASAGLQMVEDCRVLDVEQTPAASRVHDRRRRLSKRRSLVGADGSGSRVAAKVFGRRKEWIGRALMFDIPVESDRAPMSRQVAVRFRFHLRHRGNQRLFVVVSVSDRRPAPSECRNLRSVPALAVETRKPKARMLDACRGLPRIGDSRQRPQDRIQGVPDSMVHAAATFASGRVMLAGDAAGVDPLMGEGISCAFEHAKLAAPAVDGFLAGDIPRWPATTTRSIAAPPRASSQTRCLPRGAFTARTIACTSASPR